MLNSVRSVRVAPITSTSDSALTPQHGPWGLHLTPGPITTSMSQMQESLLTGTGKPYCRGGKLGPESQQTCLKWQKYCRSQKSFPQYSMRDDVRHSRCTSHWKNECPTARRHLKGQKSSINPTKENISLSQSSKTLSALPEQNQTRATWLPDPGSPGAYGHKEVRGQSMTFMVETGAEHSMVIMPMVPLTD